MQPNQHRRWFVRSLAATPVVFNLSGCGTDAEGAAGNPTSTSTQPSEVDTPTQIADLFLTSEEMATLTALSAQLVPTNDVPGALEAQCARGIQFLLSAFSFQPAMIFAGGPFSDRGGSKVNSFKQFIALDRYEELAWRIKIEGSQGKPEREFNGPVTGWQTIYREGLAALNEAAMQAPGGMKFEALPAPAQSLLLQSSNNERIKALLDIATPQTLELMYGAPEYGGNAQTVGWEYTAYDGDVQPRGYTTEQVLNPDNPGLSEMLGLFKGENFGRSSNTSVKQAGLLPVPSVSESLLATQAFRDLIGLTSDSFSLALMLDGQSSQKRIQQFVNAKKTNPSAGGNNG